MSGISKKDLLQLLHYLDKALEGTVVAVAIGGTAMTLENLKEATKDIDVCARTSKEKATLEKAFSNLKQKLIKIDFFANGDILGVHLPEDYLKRSRSVKEKFVHLQLKTLDPMDIILTKVARLDPRDEDDIEQLTKHKKIDKQALIKRFEQVKANLATSETVYQNNFAYVLRTFF